MLLLVNTTDKIQVVTDAAATTDVVASYIDSNNSDPPALKGSTSGRQLSAISTATTTDVVAAPAASTLRSVRTMNICNKSASTTVGVTVLYNANGTTYQLHKVNLRAGETLTYDEDLGWFVHEVRTNPKTALLASDFTNSSVTPAEVTGLSLVTGLGTFYFRYMLRYQTAATTTGIRLSANHAGTVSWFTQNLYWVDNSATASTAAADQDAVGAAGQVLGAMAARVKSTAGLGTTISVDTANADMMAILEGICEVTVDGELELWAGSEVAASNAVIKTGSMLVLTKA